MTVGAAIGNRLDVLGSGGRGSTGRARTRRAGRLYGARLTGGGFGGSVVMLAAAGHTGEISARVARRYGEETGDTATVLVPAG